MSSAMKTPSAGAVQNPLPAWTPLEEARLCLYHVLSLVASDPARTW
jgi:hypothetical protein